MNDTFMYTVYELGIASVTFPHYSVFLNTFIRSVLDLHSSR